MNENLMTVSEYAASKGVVPVTIYKWIKKGKLKSRKIGKITVVVLDDIKPVSV